MKTPADGWSPEERDALAGLAAELDELQKRHAADPPLDLLRAARAGVLPEPVQTQLAQRLTRGRWDRALVDGAEQAAETFNADSEARILQRIQRERSRPDRARAWRSSWWQPGLATAAVLLLAVAGWMWREDAASDRGPEPDAGRVAVDRRLTAPSFVLPLDAPEIRLSASALVYRGRPGEAGLLNDLKPALDAFRAGEYAAANRVLMALADRYPKSVEVHFYGGVARLYLADLSGADERLSRAEQIGDEAFAQDITWYRAVVDERAGRREQARTRLSALCRARGSRAAHVCAGAEALK